MLFRSCERKVHVNPVTQIQPPYYVPSTLPVPHIPPRFPNLPSIHYLLRNTIPSPIRRDQNFNMFIFMIYQFFKAFLYDII